VNHQCSALALVKSVSGLHHACGSHRIASRSRGDGSLLRARQTFGPHDHALTLATLQMRPSAGFDGRCQGLSRAL